MICGYHIDCPNEATHSISTPTGAVPSCQDGYEEWSRLWGTVTRSRQHREDWRAQKLPLPSDAEIEDLKLSKAEQRELASMSTQEREQVLARLVRSKNRKRRRALDR